MAGVLVVSWIACPCLSAWILNSKGRPTTDGWILGLLFGPLAVIYFCTLRSAFAERVTIVAAQWHQPAHWIWSNWPGSTMPASSPMTSSAQRKPALLASEN